MNKPFVLFKERKKISCSWFETNNYPNVHYIGITNGLGGYKAMLQKGFLDKRDFKPCNSFIEDEIRFKLRLQYFKKIQLRTIT